MELDKNTLIAWLTERQASYIEELRQLCAIECPTSSKAGVDQAGDRVRQWVAQHDWELHSFPDVVVGDTLVVTMRGQGRLRAMLAAHLDTVYPVGTAAASPLRQSGDHLLGPGCADNKSGLLTGLYAMAAIEALGARDQFASLSLVCGSDEETDSRASGAVLRELAPQHDLALVLEAARENGDIVSARKGNGMFVFEVQGRAAHAGVEPQRGASAILTLAHHVIALQALNGTCPGLTINVGTIEGGSVPNAVPDQARTQIDVRLSRPADMAPVEAAIYAIAERRPVPGAHTSVSGGWGFPPMDKTPDVARLVEQARLAAHELGFDLADAATGGVSYANLLAATGLPVLDGFGPIGGNDHSPREFIEIASIVPRTALLVLLLLRLAKQ